MASIKRYVIVPMGEVTDQMIIDCIQTSMETLRKNIAETECVLEYESGAKPASILAYPDYSHAETLALMNTPEWEEV